MITDAQKKYLKIIFQLGGDIELVSNKMLSKKLGAAPPSISQMLDRLTEAGFVKSEHYRGVMLTKKGVSKIYNPLDIPFTFIFNYRRIDSKIPF